jgi:predicted RNA methylase
MIEGAKPYEHPAPFYDLGWSGFAERYAEFLCACLASRGRTQARILDLGCGTGTLAITLAKASHTVHGLDASASMIRIAREKAEATPTVQFSVQRIEDFSADGEFHLVISTFGTLNYLSTLESLQAAFFRVEEGYVEQHTQRSYELDEAHNSLGAAGLVVTGTFSNLRRDPFAKDSERLICMSLKES